MSFPGGSDGKEFACDAGDLGLIPGMGRSPGEVKGYPLQYSDLENSMDSIVHGVAKSWTQLSDFHFTSLHSRREGHGVINLRDHQGPSLDLPTPALMNLRCSMRREECIPCTCPNHYQESYFELTLYILLTDPFREDTVLRAPGCCGLLCLAKK